MILRRVRNLFCISGWTPWSSLIRYTRGISEARLVQGRLVTDEDLKALGRC